MENRGWLLLLARSAWAGVTGTKDCSASFRILADLPAGHFFFIHWLLAVALRAGVLILPVRKLQHVSEELGIPLDAPYNCPVVPFCQGKAG